MNIASVFRRIAWIDDDPQCIKYDHEPSPPLKRGPAAVDQARYSAIALENDRAELRADLMRRLSHNKAQRERLEAALDELDALRILETHS